MILQYDKRDHRDLFIININVWVGCQQHCRVSWACSYFRERSRDVFCYNLCSVRRKTVACWRVQVINFRLPVRTLFIMIINNFRGSIVDRYNHDVWCIKGRFSNRIPNGLNLKSDLGSPPSLINIQDQGELWVTLLEKLGSVRGKQLQFVMVSLHFSLIRSIFFNNLTAFQQWPNSLYLLLFQISKFEFHF